MHPRKLNQMQGAALVTALVLLLILTLLGTTALRNTVMEERMAGNFYDHAVAHEAGETALRTGEGELADDTLYSALGFAGGDGTHEVDDTDHSISPYEDANFTRGVSSGVSSSVDSTPTFYLEMLPEIRLPASGLVLGFNDSTPTTRHYRVSVKGTGISPNSDARMQSTYRR
jgi:type IV pilus assembly protein PilX